jgi:DNA-binding FadR family transcriptional regulator
MVDALGTMIATAPADSGPMDLVKIAGEHDVSRNVLRESLRTLEAKGLIAAKPNSGTRVRPVREWNLLDPQVIGWRSAGPDREQQARELAQISSALEPLIARLAAKRAATMGATRRDRIAQLAETLTDAAGAGDEDRFAESDLEFHTLLAGAGANAALEYLSGVLYGQLVTGEIGLCPANAECAEAHAALAHDVLDGEAGYAESLARATIAPHRAVPGQHRSRSVHTTGDEGGKP